MTNLMESFFEYTRARSRCAEQTCVDMWTILQSPWIVTYGLMGRHVTNGIRKDPETKVQRALPKWGGILGWVTCLCWSVG